MIKNIKTYYSEHPLKSILFVGLFFRLLAVIFSKGYGWSDDEFLVIEIAQSWVDGTDYYGWLPDADGINNPKGFSFFYVGLHYLLFKFLEWIHITDPQSKMYLVRLLHALWSLIIISGGYKIALHFNGERSAKLTGWLLALMWVFPFLSVRNLVEYTSIPFLIIGVLLTLKYTDRDKSFRHWLWIGFLFSLAFSIRFQTLLFTGGVGLTLLIRKKWKETFYIATGVLLGIILLQGGIDLLVWKKPFIQLIGYVDYNLHHSHDYLTAPWYFYLTVILGLLIPPVSVYLFIGFFKSWKETLIIFLPSLIFLLFHSYFPNKQERFIVTIIPFIIIGGVIGWHQIIKDLDQKPVLKKWHKGSWIFFWIVNLILLVPVSTMYSKKARVESMAYLSKYPNQKYFIVEDVNKSVLRHPPMFYLHQWIPYTALMNDTDLNKFKSDPKWKKTENQPGFVLFLEDKNIEQRVEYMKSVFPELTYETLIHPCFMDKVLHWLNPINDNQNIYIYRNKNVYPESIKNE